MINSLLQALIVIVPLLGSIAYVTIAERKIMGSMQRRIGPNFVGQYQSQGFNQINNNNNNGEKHPTIIKLLAHKGRYYSTKRLTNVERDNFFITSNLHEVLIGITLGDLYIYKSNRNALLRFEQGLVHEAYALHLFDLFKDYCPSDPKYQERKPDSRTGKIYSKINFYTYALPCLNYYHELFYVNKIKTIPLNIGELLTPVGLAYWAMDDGNKISSGFLFSTHSYTKNEVELLIKVFKGNFDLNCTLQKRDDKYVIYIKTDSMDKFRALVTPHFHESMMYKLAA